MANNPWEGVTVWHELMSLEPERAKNFYQEVIGLTTTPLEESPFLATRWGAYQWFGSASRRAKRLALWFVAALREFFRHQRC
ncbi:MAG: hypothetical protein ACRD2L_24140 [Terriglobia bacterium]